MPRRWIDPGLFTDEKLARATVPERLLFTCLVANQDDDGRLLAHPGFLRAAAFAYDDFTLEDVKKMRDHLAAVNANVIVYEKDGHEYIQLRRHSRYQRPRYYHPSRFPAPLGWPYADEHPSGGQGGTEEPPLGEHKSVEQIPDGNQAVAVKTPDGNQMVTKKYTEGRVGLGLDLDKGRVGLGRGRDGGVGGKPPTTTTTSALNELDETAVMEELTRCYRTEWGTVHSKDLDKVIPRALGPKDRAQLRDLAKELAAGGECPDNTIQEAFREAVTLGPEKMHVSYVRAIILDWLDRPRERRPAADPRFHLLEYSSGPCAPDAEAAAAWEQVLAVLKGEVSGPNFRTWFKGTVGLRQQNGVFLVGVPSQHAAEYLDKNQRSIVEKALVNVTKIPLRLSVHILAVGGA